MSIELREQKLSNTTSVPFQFSFTYTHPPADQVPPQFQIQATVQAYPHLATITMLDGAIDLYFEVFADENLSHLL